MADRSGEFVVETSTFARLMPSIPTKKHGLFNSALFAGMQQIWIQARALPLFQLINLDQSYPRSTTIARKNSGVVPGSDCY